MFLGPAEQQRRKCFRHAAMLVLDFYTESQQIAAGAGHEKVCQEIKHKSRTA